MAVAPYGDHSLTPVAQGAECLHLALLLFVEDEGYGLYLLINFAVCDPGVAAGPVRAPISKCTIPAGYARWSCD